MSFVDFGVFYNSETCRYHLNNFKQHDAKEWGTYSDPTFFLNFKHKNSMAVLHWPYPNDPKFGELVDQMYNHCQLVVIIITELHRPSIEFMQTYDRPNIVYYVSGVPYVPLQQATVKPFFDWFQTSRFFYKEYLPEILHRFKPHDVKPAKFEILLGRKKSHRDFVYNYTRINVPASDYVMRYFNSSEPIIYEDDTHWVNEHAGVRNDGPPKKWTVEHVNYYGHSMSLSQIIPVEVYNQTAYSVVAETNYDNYYAFFTEKTAKPIIARRLFVMFGGQGYLQRLRELGFQTFGSVIDETYDTIENNMERFNAACAQIKWLCDQDQAEILEKIKPIVDHNFEVMMTRGWYDEFSRDLETRIEQLLQQT